MSSPIFFGERPKGPFLGRTLEAWLLRWRSGFRVLEGVRCPYLAD
ncbi:unnamed protein product [Prunus armeniaca]|uniref:Uncharacterized protein n=1 Tax=Prunus armeniaca TaxID=36596 RepID=A0A6J5UDT0_PRUAR|nr:unnamed protein product [Prunus armeniaca]